MNVKHYIDDYIMHALEISVLIVFLILLTFLVYTYFVKSNFTISSQINVIYNDVNLLIQWLQSFNVIVLSIKQLSKLQFTVADLAIMNSITPAYSTPTNVITSVPALNSALAITIDMSVIDKLTPILNMNLSGSDTYIRSVLSSVINIIIPSIKLDNSYYSISTLIVDLSVWLKGIYSALVQISTTAAVPPAVPTKYASIMPPVQSLPDMSIAYAFYAVHVSIEKLTSKNLIDFHNYMMIIISNAANNDLYTGGTIFNDLLVMSDLL